MKMIIKLFVLLLFTVHCSIPFPEGRLFDYMILQKLLQTNSNQSSSSTTTTTTSTNKYIFLTVEGYKGTDLGGVAGADSKCQSEKAANFASLPGAATEYKALIVNFSGTRRACLNPNCSGGISENLDWVLKANTDYFRLDGSTDTKIFTTNASGIVNFTGAGATLLTPIDSNASTKWWTGLVDDWTTNFTCVSQNWSGMSGQGGKGNGGTTGSASIGATFTDDCAGFFNKLLCVRQ